MYDRASRFVTLLWKVIGSTKPKKSARGQFWGAVQRFFRQMLIASKVRLSLDLNCCPCTQVPIGMQQALPFEGIITLQAPCTSSLGQPLVLMSLHDHQALTAQE